VKVTPPGLKSNFREQGSSLIEFAVLTGLLGLLLAPVLYYLNGEVSQRIDRARDNHRAWCDPDPKLDTDPKCTRGSRT
jgi:hypothetical protein